MTIQQPDLFGTKTQGDLFGEAEQPPVDHRPDPDHVRARLMRIVTEARAAEAMPWTRAKAQLYRTIFPQMSLWLPEDEAAQLRFEFERELERLDHGTVHQG